MVYCEPLKFVYIILFVPQKFAKMPRRVFLRLFFLNSTFITIFISKGNLEKLKNFWNFSTKVCTTTIYRNLNNVFISNALTVFYFKSKVETFKDLECYYLI